MNEVDTLKEENIAYLSNNRELTRKLVRAELQRDGYLKVNETIRNHELKEQNQIFKNALEQIVLDIIVYQSYANLIDDEVNRNRIKHLKGIAEKALEITWIPS